MKLSLLRQTKESNGVDHINLGAVRITASANPQGDGDLVSKGYVDAMAQGLDTKESVIVASETALDLVGGGLITIDGVSLSVNDRVLVMAQADSKFNGIYLAQVGSWTRSLDMDGNNEFVGSEVSGGNFVFVENGTKYAGSGFVTKGKGVLTLGTDQIIWIQFSRQEDYTAGRGLTRTGQVFSVVVADFVGSNIEDDGSNNLRVSTAIAGAGLTGGGADAVSVVPSNTVEANLARAISVNTNGLAVKIDDKFIGENGSKQLTLKADCITPNEMDISNAIPVGTGIVLSYNNVAGKMEWTTADALVKKPALKLSRYIVGTDITPNTDFSLPADLADTSDVAVFWNGVLCDSNEYVYKPVPNTLAIIPQDSNDFQAGDVIMVLKLTNKF